MFELLTPGQKLKKLRKELHLTQAQLASNTISREFISMVEHDLRKLSAENAMFLAEQLRQFGLEKNLPVTIPDDYLAIAPAEEFQRLTAGLNLEETSLEDLEALHQQAIQLDHPRSQGITLNFLAKKLFYSDFDQSFQYFLKAKEVFATLSDSHELIKINNNLGALCQVHHRFNDAVIFLEMALQSDGYEPSMAEKSAITLNLALLYSKLQWHDKCLTLLDEDVERRLFTDLNPVNTNLLILRGLALADTGNVPGARTLLEKLEPRLETTDPLIYYLRSSKIYIMRKLDLQQAIQDQQDLIQALSDPFLLLQNLELLGDLYFENQNFPKSLHYHQAALNQADAKTYPEILLGVYEKIKNDREALGEDIREPLFELITFCAHHRYHKELLKYGLLFLSKSAGLKDDDAKVVAILNKAMKKDS